MAKADYWELGDGEIKDSVPRLILLINSELKPISERGEVSIPFLHVAGV